MSIVVERLVKSYGAQLVVNQVSFEVAPGECFVLLGPSGSGKSTVLRMLAGLTEPDGGRIVVAGRNVAELPPQKRGMGFVFQNYALFGHLTVAENLEFPLQIRHVSARDRRARRGELLELVGLVGLDQRFPHQLSGGQQQRVALARAIAAQPDVLLLDEPFGALDARIRIELRRTLLAIQRELGVTTLFVTHDQEEAFELADHLGVMNFGNLLEVGPPHELYLRPRTEFVATFLGRANLLVGESDASGLHVGPLRLSDPIGAESGSRRRVQVLFRPEDVAVKTSPELIEWPSLGEGVVEEVSFSGSIERLRLRLPEVRGLRPIAPAVQFGSDDLRVEAQRSQHLASRYPLRPGDRAHVGVRRVHALAHPGLSFLVVATAPSLQVDHLRQVGHLARQTHARVQVIVSTSAGEAGSTARQVRERIGSGLASLEVRCTSEDLVASTVREAKRHPYDLVIATRPARHVRDMVEALLSSGAHHLLLLDDTATDFTHFVLCVAGGEPAKSDVRFSARLLRHLGASVEVLTVVPQHAEIEVLQRVERFQGASLRTLALFGVEGGARIERGDVIAHLRACARRNDVLVLGAPLAEVDVPLRLRGVLASALELRTAGAVLVVRAEAEEGGARRDLASRHAALPGV